MKTKPKTKPKIASRIRPRKLSAMKFDLPLFTYLHLQGVLQLVVICVAVQLNALLTAPPIVKALTTIAAATAATRIPYSTPAAPLSSLRSLFKNPRMTVLPFPVNKAASSAEILAAVKNLGLK